VYLAVSLQLDEDRDESDDAEHDDTDHCATVELEPVLGAEQFLVRQHVLLVARDDDTDRTAQHPGQTHHDACNTQATHIHT